MSSMPIARVTAGAALAAALLLAACGGGGEGKVDERLSVELTPRAFGASPGSSASPVPSSTPATTPTPGRACDDPSAFARIRPSVVRIEVGAGMGTGFAVAPDLIMTAEHVVSATLPVRLTLPDGRTLPASVIARLPSQDLALLRLSGASLPPVAWGDDRALRPGQPLLALGYARDLPGEPSLTGGRFSARRTDDGVDYVQTDTPLNPGNSGGPLFTQCGEVVGVVSFGLRQGQGLNFAVAARHARELAANPAATPPATSPLPSPTRAPSPLPSPTPIRTPGGPASPLPSRAPSPAASPSPTRFPPLSALPSPARTPGPASPSPRPTATPSQRPTGTPSPPR